MQPKRISSHQLYFIRPITALFSFYFGLASLETISLFFKMTAIEASRSNMFEVLLFHCGIFVLCAITFYDSLGTAHYVQDQGDRLFIKKRKIQETVELKDIKFIEKKCYSGTILLHFISAKTLSVKIGFLPKSRKTFHDLSNRIYEAHVKQ
jgi:hypothetical protein